MASGSGGVSDGGGSRSVSVVMTLSIVPCPGDCLDRATRLTRRRGLTRATRIGHELNSHWSRANQQFRYPAVAVINLLRFGVVRFFCTNTANF